MDESGVICLMSRRDRIPHYDDPAEVGRRLHEARTAAGLSQRELAFPGCSAAYISRVERGQRIPSLQVIRELAARIGISESALAYGAERLHPDVAHCIRDAEAAEATGERLERARAYGALGRTSARVARALEKGG